MVSPTENDLTRWDICVHHMRKEEPLGLGPHGYVWIRPLFGLNISSVQLVVLSSMLFIIILFNILGKIWSFSFLFYFILKHLIDINIFHIWLWPNTMTSPMAAIHWWNTLLCINTNILVFKFYRYIKNIWWIFFKKYQMKSI